jgi:protein-tyrosine-phosphatase
MATRGRVLVLDGARVHALDIVRSLGRRGLSVSVAANVHDAIGFSSRFASAARVYPDPVAEPEAFIAWLHADIRSTGYDLVIPVTDVTSIPISRNLTKLSALCPFATEAFDKVQLVSDKSRTLEIAQRLDVPCPATVVVRHADEIAHRVAQLRFPVVCKPLASGTWGPSGYVALPVSYALDEHELRRDVTKRLDTSPVLLQEYRRGAGVGIEVLAHEGTIVQAFQHERLHELPLSGGASTYRVSMPLDPVLLDYSARLLEHLRWTGVAMVEFKVDRATSDIALMEINGRFWGSLALSTRAGMAFASDLYDLLTTGRTVPSRSYRTGVRCRKLRDDIEWLKNSVTVNAQHPLVVAGVMRTRSSAELMAAVLRMFWPLQHYDVQVLWDPRPGLIDVRDILVAHARAAARQIVRRGRKARAWWYCRRNKGKLARRAGRARNVLFVCYGNIMRSPFASAYLASRSRSARTHVQTASAGCYDKAGRAADPRAVAAGQQWQIDLSAHRSRTLDPALLDWADLILVMDRSNLEAVCNHYPAAREKTYLLGSIDAADHNTDGEIPDPFTGSDETVVQAYGRIAGAIDRLIVHVSSGSAS